MNFDQIIPLAAEFLVRNPAKAMHLFFMLTPVRNQLLNTLTDEQLEWLSHDIQTRPTGLLEFCNTNAGRQEMARFMESYQKAVVRVQQQPRAITLTVAPDPLQKQSA